MFVKVCGVTRVEDARLAIELGASAVGFIFADSPRRVTEEQVTQIVSELADVIHDDLHLVGVFRNQPVAAAIEQTLRVGLNTIQLHGSETLEETKLASERVPSVLKAFVHTDPALLDLEKYGDVIPLVDSPRPGSGVPFDWKSFTAPRTDFLLAGGLSPSTIREAVEITDPWGVDLVSGLEVAHGIKDSEKMKKFFEILRELENS